MDLKSAEETIPLVPSEPPSGSRSKRGSSFSDSGSRCSSNDTGFASGEDHFDVDLDRSFAGESCEEYTDASCADPSLDSSLFSTPNSVGSFDLCDHNFVCDYSEEAGDDADVIIEPSVVQKESFFGDNLRCVDGNLGVEARDYASVDSYATSDAILGEHDFDNLESEDHGVILGKKVEKVEYNGDEIINGKELGVDNGFLTGGNGDKSVATAFGKLNAAYPAVVDVNAGVGPYANGVEQFEMKDEFMVIAELYNGCIVGESTKKCLDFAPVTDRTMLWDPLGLNVVNSNVRVLPFSLTDEEDLTDTVTLTSEVQLGANSTMDGPMTPSLDNGFIMGKTVENCSVSDASFVTLNPGANGEHLSNLKDVIISPFSLKRKI